MKAKAFRAAAFAVLLGPATCSGSMVKYDTSLGEFKIQCPVGSYCLVSGKYAGMAAGATGLYHGIPPDMEEDDRFSPLRSFHWLESDELAFISGQPTSVDGTNNYCVEGDLEGLECQATCDEACVCQREVDAPLDIWPNVNDNSPSCPILETFPNHSVAHPSEYVVYESSAQLPDKIEVICKYPYGECSQKGGGSFVYKGGVGEDGVHFFHSYSDCNNPDGPCYLECPPQCTCTATDGNSATEECKVAVSPTPAPTAAATEKPTGNPSSAAPAVLIVRAWTSLGLSIFGYIFVNKLAG